MTELMAVLGAASVPDEDIGKAGPVGLFLILSLLIVVFLLGRSMRTHLRRVPLEFPDPNPPAIERLDEVAAADDALEGEIIDRPGGTSASREPRRQRPDGSHPDVG